MGINSLDQVWANLLAIGIVVFIFYWLYQNLKDQRTKKSIGKFFRDIMESIKGDKE